MKQNDLYNTVVTLLPILEQYDDGSISPQISCLIELKNSLEKGETIDILTIKNILYPPRGGLSDFFVWQQDYSERLKINRQIEELSQKIWEYLNGFDSSVQELSTETLKEFLEQNLSASLQNPEIAQKLFSPEGFTTLIRESVTVELEPQKIDSIGLVDGHLELLLLDPIGWQEEIEGVHLELLQEKLNNYLYYIESKQYAERYGDQFDKKVINLTFQYSPSDKGLAFLAAAQKTLSPTDIHLKIVLPDE